MAQFTDSQNRIWQIKLTGPVLQRIKSDLKVELANLDSDPMRILRADPLILQMTVYLLCQSQSEKLGLTADEFADSLPSPPDAMIEAVEEAIVNFFPTERHTHIREGFILSKKMGAKLYQLSLTKAEGIIEDPKNFERIGIKVDQEIEKEMRRIFGPDTTHTPATT